MASSERATEAGGGAGPAEALLQQLTAKFGVVPEVAADWVRGADVASLDRWTETILSAPTMKEGLLLNVGRLSGDTARLMADRRERVRRGDAAAEEDFRAIVDLHIREADVCVRARVELCHGMSLEAYEEERRRPNRPADVFSLVELAVSQWVLALERRSREEKQPAPDASGEPVERPAESRHRG